MGGVSAMSSIARVMEKHAEEIQQDYLQEIPDEFRDTITGVVLTGDTYHINVEWELKTGHTLSAGSIDIDTLAERYPDCDVSY